ncbi:DUF1134 domain-containing protein [Methyloceanibacter sp.]|uniref:DUF1134 domain-containing protein n=1 Tax=Methyloceanibacter sp. TaxID=1965321 RepID=UPI00351B4539
MHWTFAPIAALAAVLSFAPAARAADEASAASTAPSVKLAQADGPMVMTPQPDPNRRQVVQPQPLPPPQTYGNGTPPPSGQTYVSREAKSGDTFSPDEIKETGHRFFGKVSMGFARVVEYVFQRAGRPNGYILGEEAGGAFIAGLRYGEGMLYTKDAGDHRIFWQGPSLGYDFGAEGSKTMVLVYDLRGPREIFNTFAGVDGSAYFIGGVGVTFLRNEHIMLAPIRSGVGLRLGANIGYLKYTPQPTWNPF